MSGQCLCSWCVEVRPLAREVDRRRREREAGERARAMREARERAGAS